MTYWDWIRSSRKIYLTKRNYGFASVNIQCLINEQPISIYHKRVPQRVFWYKQTFHLLCIRFGGVAPIVVGIYKLRLTVYCLSGNNQKKEYMVLRVR